MSTPDSKDLSYLIDDLKEVFEEHGFEDPALALAFTLPEDRSKVHWVANVKREHGARLFAATAAKMRSELN